MILTVRHVSKMIRDQLILNDISFTLTGGKIYGFRGKNGSGKTMLMRAICGLIFPTSGQILIDDMQLGKQISFPPSVGVLLETPEFIGHYTALQNLEMLASIRNQINSVTISDLLNYFDLDPKSKKKFKTFSLGMKQKVGIIAALMEEPDLIILDEPLNALDEQSVRKVKDLLIKHKQRGALCIITCHDREELEFLSDEIFYIENGSLKKHYRVGDNE